VIVAGLEEDSFVASAPETLARSLRPVYAHLVGRPGRVELTGLERPRWPFGGKTRQVPLEDLGAAIRYLLDGS
jgi:hypothetical protein